MEDNAIVDRFEAGSRRSVRLQNRMPKKRFRNTIDTPIDIDAEMMMKNKEDKENLHVGTDVAPNSNPKTTRRDELSDSDFCEPPPGKRSKASNKVVVQPKNVEANIVVKPQSLRTRTSPKALFNTVKDLNPEQRKAVEDIGMGSLLGMKVDGIPGKLGFYLVDNLVPSTMILELGKGNIAITEQSIHDILGIPASGLDIWSRPQTKDAKDLSDAWLRQFNNKEHISPTDVLTVVKQSRDAGPLFKLNFLMIAINVLAECNRVGACQYNFLYHLDGVHMIPKINWCKFVYESLRRSKNGWRKDCSTSYYAGPLTYLTLLYVESTHYSGLKLSNTDHPLKSWDLEHLQIRQDWEINRIGLGNATLLSSGECNDPAEAGPSEIKDRDQIRKELIKYVDERILVISQSRCEAEIALLKGLEEYPEDSIFATFKAEMASIFKRSQFDNNEHQNSTPTTNNNALATSKSVGSDVKIYNLSNTNKVHDPSSEHTKGQTGTSGEAFVSRSPLEPILMIEYGPQHAENVVTPTSQFLNVKCNGPKHNSLDKGKGIAPSSEDQCGIVMANVGSEIPSFDLGISPEKNAKEAAIEDQNKRIQRPTRSKRPSEKMRSPFLERAASFEITGDERKLHDWVMRTTRVSSLPIYKSLLGKTVNHKQLMTLASDLILSKSIIDGWTQVLNEEEAYRSDGSPRQYFFTTDVAGCTKITDPQFTDDMRYAFYLDMLELSTRCNTEILSLKDVDLVFFPVVERSFFYMIVFNLKQPSCDVLDSEHRIGDEFDLYDMQPAAMCGMMKTHLRAQEHVMCKSFQGVSPKVTKLSWQVIDKKTHKGVVLMRMMETYMGEPLDKWKCGLFRPGPRQTNQIKSLRTKYISKLVTNKGNGLKEGITTEVLAFMSREAALAHKKKQGF